jgi:hypothetical protein
MTLARRVAKLEEALSPTQLVLRWMTEAHTYGDVPAYVASLLAEEPPVAPIDRLAREAIQGARVANKGKRPDVVQAAIRTALRETIFRYELVLRINVVAHDLLDREGLIDAALSAQIALVACGRDRDDQASDRLAKLRDLVLYRLGELSAAQEARTLVEGRYLDGHPALFPDVAAAWVEQVQATQLIADMAGRFGELAGAPAGVPPDHASGSGRTAELAADLVEPAKAEALDKVGEGRRAFEIASDWVRAASLPPRSKSTAADP